MIILIGQSTTPKFEISKFGFIFRPKSHVEVNRVHADMITTPGSTACCWGHPIVSRYPGVLNLSVEVFLFGISARLLGEGGSLTKKCEEIPVFSAANGDFVGWTARWVPGSHVEKET